MGARRDGRGIEGEEGLTPQGLERAAIHHIGNGGNAFVNVPSYSNRKRPTVKSRRTVYRQANFVRRTLADELQQPIIRRRGISVSWRLPRLRRQGYFM
ncbi:MAG TPA: hypothetical protein PKW18_05285 [Candidatus Sumerlaeota bacterium]|nr:hypothetical protein [Candidatus Sumerlaeota bacterium]HPL73970.1 hypothetical protein [Candidatus Sumerlaeota bacterium]HQH11643.1 hypothetical protein [Candidatus Sumerlaeota bacterium]